MRSFPAIMTILISFNLGCSDDFAPYSQLDRLRILAVQSEPANPRPNEPTRITALVFAPNGVELTKQWSWCPVAARGSERYQCPIGETSASEAMNTLVTSFDLGSGDEVWFTNPLSLEKASELCTSGIRTAGYSFAPDCDEGFPMTTVLDVTAGSQSLRAGFSLFLPTNAQSEFNTNPEVIDLSVSGVSLSSESPPVIRTVSKKLLPLRVTLAPNAAESRPLPPSEAGSGRRLERLTFSWFADVGRMEKDRTVFIDGVNSLEEATLNQWSLPEAESFLTGTVTFYVVVRDDRGGVGWLWKRVGVERQS